MKKAATYIIVILMVPFSIWSMVDFITSARTRSVRDDIVSAWQESEAKHQAIVDRGEYYISELKKIDSEYCKDGVQEALNTYIEALEMGIEAFKENKDTSPNDKKAEGAKLTLSAIFKTLE